MIKNIKGVTLIELLVTLVIVGIVMAAVYTTYTNLLAGYKQESKIAQSQGEELTNVEMLRVDVLNAGLGIADNETKNDTTNLYPMYWDKANKTLTINSTYDRVDPKTFGWSLLKCTESSGVNTCEIITDTRESDNYTTMKVLDVETNALLSNVQYGTPATTDQFYAIGYPYDTNDNTKYLNGAPMKYVPIVYSLKTDCDGDGASDLPSDCHPGTKLICRNKVPVVDCVSDMNVFFGYESSGSIVYSDNVTDAGNLANIKRFVLYGVAQQGVIDKNFDFIGTSMTFDKDFIADGDASVQEVLAIPDSDSFSKYRWHLFSIDVKTVNIK